MDKLYIVMPAYNEVDNIEITIKEWYPIIEQIGNDSKLVIAPSGSDDGTIEKISELKKKCEHIELLLDTDRYHGPKVLALYKYAVNNKADYIFQTDSDGQTNPADFDFFWNKREEYDAILGNRIVRGDGKIRKIVECVVCLIVKIIFGVNVPDANAPFRLMKTDMVEKYINILDENYNLPNIMFTVFFKYYGEKILFKEIEFRPRTKGMNSINLVKIFKIGTKAIKDFSAIKKKM